MELRDFIEAAERYASEGDAVNGQLQGILDGEALAEQNRNALKYIAAMLRDVEQIGVEVSETADRIEEFLALDQDSDEHDEFVL